MKRLLIVFTLFVSSCLIMSCSLKHKLQTKGQEKLTQNKQSYLNHLITTEHVILDTSLQYAHMQLQNHQLWRLSGNVKMHPDGWLQTDHATLQTWHNAVDSQQTTSFKTSYKNQSEDKEARIEESTAINKKSTYKQKRKFTTNLWWLVLLLPLLLLWFFRRNRNS